MKDKTRKILGSGLVILAAGVGLGAGFYFDNPEAPEPIETIVIEEVIKNVTITEYVDNEVIVNVPFEDETFLEMVCDRMGYDDNYMDCKDEIWAEQDALDLSIELIEEDFADALEDFDFVDDEDDAELIKVYTDFSDVKVIESDFEDEEYKFFVKAKVADDEEDEKFKVWFLVEVEDGEAEIKDVISDEDFE